MKRGGSIVGGDGVVKSTCATRSRSIAFQMTEGGGDKCGSRGVVINAVVGERTAGLATTDDGDGTTDHLIINVQYRRLYEINE